MQRITHGAERAAIALAVLCGLAWVVQGAGERVRPYVEAAIGRASGLPAHIDTLQLGLFPPRVWATGIEIGTPLSEAPQGRAWLRIATLRITPHPGSLVVLWPVLGEVLADGVAVEARLPAAGAPSPDEGNAPRPGLDPRQFALPLDVRSAKIALTRVSLVADAYDETAPLSRVTLRDASVRATPIGWRERRIEADIGSLVAVPRVGLAASPPVLAAQAHLSAVVHGSLRRPRHVQLERAQLVGEHAHLSATGEARLDGPYAPLSAECTGDVQADAPWLAWALPIPPAWQAWRRAPLRLTTDISGHWQSVHTSFTAQLAGPTVGPVRVGTSAGISGSLGNWGTSGDAGGGASGVSGPAGTSGSSGRTGTSSSSGFSEPSLGEVGMSDPFLSAAAQLRVEGRFDGERCIINDARLSVDHQNVLRAVGEWQVRPLGTFSLSTEAHSLRLGPLWQALAMPGPVPLTGAVTGRTTFHGTLAQKPHASIRFEWRTQPLTLWRTPTRSAKRPAPAPERIAGLVAAQLTGSAELGRTGVLLREASIAVGEDRLMLEGRWQPGDGAKDGLQMRLWTDGFRLDALSPIAQLGYRGLLSFGGSVEARSLREVHARANVEAEQLAIGPVRVGSATARMSFHNATLRIADLVNRRGAGALSGDVRIEFGQRRPQLTTQLHAERVDTSDLLRDIGVPLHVAQAFGGSLWGNAELSGDLARPRGGASLQSPRLTAYNLDLGRAQLTLGGQAGSERLSGVLSTRAARGALSASAALDGNGHVRLRVSGADVPLAPAVPALSEQSELTLRLALDGPKDGLDGTLTAYVARREAAAAPADGDDHAGGLSLVVRAQAGVATFDMHALQGAMRAHGRLQLRGPLGLEMRGQLGGVTATDVAMWVPSLVGPAKQMGLVVHGDVAVHGPAADWRAMAVQLHIASLGGRLLGTPISLSAPVTLSLSHGTLDVPRTQMQSRALKASLIGKAQLWAAPGDDKMTLRRHQAMALDGTLQGDLAALSPWLPALTAAKGNVRAALRLQGSLERPLLLGDAEISNGAMRLSVGDQFLEHMALKVVFSGRGLALTVGHATLGRGRISLQGEWSLGRGTWLDPRGPLSLRARLDHVPFRPMPDLSSRLGGSLELSGDKDTLRLQGDLKVESMRYTARLDLDRLLRKRRAPPLKAAFLPFSRPVTLGIKLRAQNDAIISSKLLEAELSGDLFLTGTSDRVGLLGSVTPLWARARYRDNVFVISRGTVDFTDEYRIAPVYSIEGRTRACQMDASVIVQGDSEGYSLTPTGRDEHGMVDAQDVLSCLHMGVRLSDFAGTYGHTAGFNDALSGSFDALWTVSGLDDKVRKFLPIRVDELRLTSGWSSINQRTTPRVVVGRELGRRVALRYVRSIDEVSDQAFTLETKLDPTKTMQFGYMSARDVPTGDFGVDLRLHWELP